MASSDSVAPCVDAVAIAVTSGEYGPGVYKCTATKCMCCDFVVPKKEFRSTKTTKSHNIENILTCKSSNVIYIIQCKKCSAQYVGKTVTALKTRFGAHKSSIIKKEHRPLPDHFNNNGHTLEDLEIFPIEQVINTKQLKEREIHWIRELQTLEHKLNLGPYEAGRCQIQQNEGGNEDETVVENEACQAKPKPAKRKRDDNTHGKAKKTRKLKNKTSVYSPWTEEVLNICEDALEDIRPFIAQVYQKLQTVTCKKTEDAKFLEELKREAEKLKERTISEKIYIGLFGKTGAGKSSLINAIVDEDWLLPSGSMSACTSVLVYVQANTESNKYKAEIEFISKEDWESELRFLVETIANENDTEHMDGDDYGDDLLKMAKDKITSIYGEEGLDKSFDELMRTRDGPDIPESGKKTFKAESAKELSKKISCYIRCNPNKTNQVQYWPVVKCVTISLPQSPALLENVVLVDLPGTGDANKHRDEMWKQCISQCASVWIVSEINRSLSEKEVNVIFSKSLRSIAGGGECHNITFIATKTDDIKVEEFQMSYNIEISEEKGSPDYETKAKQECVNHRNAIVKEQINKTHKTKVEKLLLGDEGNSNSYFNVFTVSSDEYKALKQRKKATLNLNDTDLPFLQEHIKNISASHLIREVKDYTTEVTGIVSLLHISEITCDGKIEEFNAREFTRLEREVDKSCITLKKILDKAHNELQTKLSKGKREAVTHCLKNLDKVLKPKDDNRGYHKTLKALCRNDGYYRSSNGDTVDLNYTLAEPFYEQVNQNLVKLFGSSYRSSLQGKFDSFLEDLIRIDSYKTETTKYLRMLYIKTKQRKILCDLEKEVFKKKKTIYNCLSDTIQKHMRSTYNECAQIAGKGFLKDIEEKLKDKIRSSSSAMFQDAVNTFLTEFTELKEQIVDTLKTQMIRSLRVALSQLPNDLCGLPDLKEEFHILKKHCDDLGLKSFV